MTADLKVDLRTMGSPIVAVDQPEKKEKEKAEEKKMPVFMQAHDVTTANDEDAKKIGEFLNSRAKQKERKNEIQEYLIENGKTKEEARKLAKAQVENEKSQANAKRTVVFIDKAEYEKYVKEQGEDSPYKATLIEDPEVLQMIRGERLKTKEAQIREVMGNYFELDEKGQPKEKEDGSPILKDGVEEADLEKFFTKDKDNNYVFDREKFKANQKEEHLKKFFKTDATSGELLEDNNGNYIFDSDKYKTEMENDVTAYRLTLADRKEGAEKRGYEKSDEKHAIQATGMDVKKDRTTLYRVLYLAGVAAAAIFTKAKANAYAKAEAHVEVHDSDGNPIPITDENGVEHPDGRIDAEASDEAHAVMRAWPVLGLAAATPFIKDKDCDDGRKEAQSEFEPAKKEPCPECPPQEPCDCGDEPLPELVEHEPVEPLEEGVQGTIINIPAKTDCDYTIKGGKTVKTIKYGGYWHYANLYKDCTTGKPLTKKQLAELTQKLKPGHDGSSIQKDGKNRVLQERIKLDDGTEVCLCEDNEIPAIIAKMEKLANGGGKDMKLADKKVGIYDCNGNLVGTASSEQEAKQKINTLKGQQNPVQDTSYTLRSAE